MVDETGRSDEDDETPLREVVVGVVVGLVLLVGFALMFLGYPFFWVAFAVGFAGVLPAAIGLTKLYERRRERGTESAEPTGTESALETLRRRYATGEIDEAEFERRVDALLGTETVEDAESYVRDAHREREYERERGR